ncbi:hypothetical protein UlMin_002884 [Ulmus minor]
MALQKLTDYERKRLENIRRNDELMFALKIQSMAAQLSASIKRQRNKTKSYKVSPQKKSKPETPVVKRRSLRTRGMPPDSKELADDFSDSAARNAESQSPTKVSTRSLGPISMREACSCKESSDRPLIETILGIVDSDPENIARVVPGMIMNVRFFPCADSRMIVAGNQFGEVGFWNLDPKVEEKDGIYLYHPHSSPILGISIQPHCLSKVITSCYNGYIWMMDAEKEVFDLIYSSDDTIFSLSQRPNDVKCLYFGEGRGGLSIWDERTGKRSSEWVLHEDKINSIDFNSKNPSLMTTSSSDRTACIWDLRIVNADKPNTLTTIRHKRALHSAYFSPSGRSLATASFYDTVGIHSGPNFEDTSMVPHYNRTGTRISSFRAIWGWDDSHIFIGNMKRGIDIISPAQRKTIFTLESPNVTAIPCRFDAHPYNVGMLAGATSVGQVYVWTMS